MTSRRFLVTGGAGFIGSHLTDRLLSRGDSVVVLDNLSTGRIGNLDKAQDSAGLRFVHGSVLEELIVDELVNEVDVVVHLAAAVGVRLIVEQPLRSFVTNIRGAEIVIGAAHRYRKPVLVASTSEIYGKNSDVPLREDADRVLGAPAVARWAYSTSKAVDEILALTMHRERGLPAVVARMFNTVGPRQSPAYGMVIPRFVNQALAGEPLTVYGDGSQTRCFCHVADVVGALASLLDDPGSAGEVFNVGSTEEVTILELAERVNEACGNTSGVKLIGYDEAYESGFEDMVRRVPDVAKIREHTGWTPTHDLDFILADTIAETKHTLGENGFATDAGPAPT